MERKGSKLRRMQDEIFKEAWGAQSYYNAFRHYRFSSDREYIDQQHAIYEELSYLISHMGWTADYLEYCEKTPAPYVSM